MLSDYAVNRRGQTWCKVSWYPPEGLHQASREEFMGADCRPGLLPGGRRHCRYENVKGKRADADRLLREILVRLDKGLPVDASRLTVVEYLEMWHRNYAPAKTRPRTAERYRTDFRNHLVPQPGHLKLTEIMREAV